MFKHGNSDFASEGRKEVLQQRPEDVCDGGYRREAVHDHQEDDDGSYEEE
jgi:hypothetical protein